MNEVDIDPDKQTKAKELEDRCNMGMFDINEENIKAFYHRAWLECNRGFVDPRRFPYLDKALIRFARDNNCSYDEALILAKTGKRMGRLAK